MIQKVQIGEQEYEIGQVLAAIAQYFTITDKGNFQIASPLGTDGVTQVAKNINIESGKNIKIKPGSGGQIELLPDHTGDVSEVLIKVQTSVDSTGAELSSEIPVRCKINSTELELNTKGATDTNVYDVKFKTGLKESKNGEHYCQTKLKGRSFDLRCYEHGGIALQTCGKDGENFENKIKFESSRTNGISGNTAGTYSNEGGTGLEFGTFNNLHTSLYTKTYRFNQDGKVYAVRRGTPELFESGKVDYPTQADDFKDIIDDESKFVTWDEIVRGIQYLIDQGYIAE